MAVCLPVFSSIHARNRQFKDPHRGSLRSPAAWRDKLMRRLWQPSVAQRNVFFWRHGPSPPFSPLPSKRCHIELERQTCHVLCRSLMKDMMPTSAEQRRTSMLTFGMCASRMSILSVCSQPVYAGGLNAGHVFLVSSHHVLSLVLSVLLLRVWAASNPALIAVACKSHLLQEAFQLRSCANSSCRRENTPRLGRHLR